MLLTCWQDSYENYTNSYYLSNIDCLYNVAQNKGYLVHVIKYFKLSYVDSIGVLNFCRY